MQTAPEIIARKFLNRTDRHIFLTGKAGTGKTTFLRNIINQTHKKAVISAPTGVAAINAGGVTLHSLFQLPFGTYVPSDAYHFQTAPGSEINTPRSLMRNLHMHSTKRRLLQEIELLIIDEVSMLRADILDAIDRVLRAVRRQRSVPFGGVQLLFIGDLLQLPPVVKDDEWSILREFYKSIHFFEALALKNEPPLYIELEKIYRQSDPVFINLLNHFRDNCVTREDVEILNRHFEPGFSPGNNEGYIHLTTHNRIADEINRKELEKLNGKIHSYSATIEKDFNQHQFPVDMELRLKEGAQVMFIKNDPSGEKRFFNGKIGTVTELDPDGIEVGFTDGTDPVFVEKYTWYNKKYRLSKETNEIREEVMGSFVHYPLKLAWAVTIHKSQGLTFEKAIIDVQRAFAPGQIYVALSRLVSLEGLILSSKVPVSGFETDQHIASFSNKKLAPEETPTILERESHNFIRKKLLQYYDFSNIEDALMYHLRTYTKDEKRSAKQNYKSKILEIIEIFRKEQQFASNFSKQIQLITSGTGNEYLVTLHERVQAAKNYFEPKLTNISRSIIVLIEELKDAVGVKQYVKELQELESVFFSKLQAIRKSVELIEAVQNNQDLKKREYASVEEKEARNLLADKIAVKKKKGSKKKQTTTKTPQMKKGESAKISFNMAKQGKSIPEIAKEREMAVSTIEGHLVNFVRSGDLNILELMDEEKVTEINAALKRYYKDSMKPVKNILGDEYSYGEIKMVLASQ